MFARARTKDRSGTEGRRRPQAGPASRLAGPSAVLIVAASLVALPGASLPAQGSVTEENVVRTGDLGVVRPTGIAWDPVADVLWIGEPGDGALVGLSRDGREVLDVRRTDVDPATATIDADGGLTSVDGSTVTVEDADGSFEAFDVAVEEPTAVTTDPATADVVVLDASGPSLVRLSSEGDVQETSLDDSLAGDELDAVAVDPKTGLVNVADWSTDTVYAVDDSGALVEFRTVESESLVDPGAMTFAPTADSTDAAGATSLYVVDAGSEDVSGGVVELSLAAVELATATDVAPLVQTTELSSFDPPSPDSAGVTWLADTDRLLIADSEVNEMPIFENVNLFETTRGGALRRTGVTLPWSDEPTGVSQDLVNNRLFVSDDRSSGKLHTVRRGSDGRWGTADDEVTTATMGSFGFGTVDAEDVTYHAPSNSVFVVDGLNAEVWRISPGPDGVFTGGGSKGDDTISHFDLAVHGIQDPEGIVHNTFDDTLLIADRRTDLVHELTLTGGLVRIIDISAAGARTPAGITLAPSSDGAGTSMYVVDRGVDNDADPNENDGRLHELRFPGAAGNLPPIAADDSATTVVDEAVTIDVLANDADPDGEPLTVDTVSTAANGTTAVTAGGSVLYTPNADFNGVDNFTYTASDGTFTSNVATVTVSVNVVNNAPVAFDDTATTDEDVSVNVDVLANDADADGDALTVTNLSTPANGTAVLEADGTVTYTPAANVNGADSFTYTASDGVLDSITATVSITVNAVDDPPVAVDDSASTRVATAVTIDVLANDSDVEGLLDPASVTVTTAPSDGTTSVGADGSITYTPGAAFSGSDTFDYQVCDGGGACASATVTVTVSNAVVEQFAQSETTSLGAVLSGTFAATTDADGVTEVLTEQHSGGPRASRASWLDHRWTLQVVNGEAMHLDVVASRSANGEGDDFAFELSRDGGASWQRVLTVATGGTPTLHTGELPPATRGTVLVRVVDTDRTAGNSGIDAVTVDRLVIRTVNPLGFVPDVAVTAPDAQADEGGGIGMFRITRSDTAGTLAVAYDLAGTATPGSDYAPLPGMATFADGQALVDVIVTPLQDADVEGDESVELALAVSASYTIVAPGTATVVIADDEVAASDARATAQTTGLGSVQGGTVASTHFDDGDVETLREEYTQGRWRARLDHRWTFQVAGGTRVEFLARVHRLGTENMVFSWSTNGSTWTPLVTVDSGTEQAWSADLPATVSGTVQVRVTDTVDDKNDVDRGSVVVDELVIRSTP